jgi:hypothetical protein
MCHFTKGAVFVSQQPNFMTLGPDYLGKELVTLAEGQILKGSRQMLWYL